MEIFDAYAQYYDLIYKDKDYSSESDYIIELIKKYNSNAKSILELGCGTGMHALSFSRNGFNVKGIDVSEKMIKQAIERCKSSKKTISDNLSFEIGDVRTWRCETTFDAVISLFHVMSYQNKNEDVASMLNTASDHLPEGGLLIFDFWYGPTVLSEQPEVKIKRLENETFGLTRIAEPDVYLDKNVVQVNYEIIMKNKTSGALNTLRETHSMRYFFIPEWLLFLTNANFQLIDCFEWMTKTSASEKGWSAVIVAQKK